MTALAKRPVPAGLVRFACPTHGPVVDTFKSAAVVCRCGKTAKAVSS